MTIRHEHQTHCQISQNEQTYRPHEPVLDLPQRGQILDNWGLVCYHHDSVLWQGLEWHGNQKCLSRSQASQPSRRTHQSWSSKHSSYSSSHRSTVLLTRVKESFNKAALLAEAWHLAEKQELMRQELELSIAKQSLELNTKLSIATTKENVLCEFEAGSSLLSVSRVVKSEPVSDTISPSVTDHQSVKQAESTPMYTSPSSHLPVHPSIRP